jgi:hypothetical protein
VLVLARAWSLRTAGAPALPRFASRLAVGAAAVLLLTLAIDAVGANPSDQTSYASTYHLCCNIEPRATVLLEQADRVVGAVDQRLVPIIANPDLGKLAYAQRAQIVDLGQIGDPLYLEVSTVSDLAERERLTELYLGTVYPPDVVQVGAAWTCDLHQFMSTPAFQRDYERVEVGSASTKGEGSFDGTKDCGGSVGRLHNGVWVLRNPASRADLQLAAKLLDGDATVDATWFDPCRRSDLQTCMVRLRAFQRAFPGSANVHRASAALRGLDTTAEGRLVTALVRSPDDPGWSQDAFDALRDIDGSGRER